MSTLRNLGVALAAPVMALGMALGLPQATPARAADHRAETAPNQFVTVGDTKFAYRSFGSGSPVVFLHRFRATMDHWDPALLDLVATRHRVIVFDNVGISLSTGETPNTVVGMADDVARFMHALGIEQADFVGWSLGGMVAQAVLVRHPRIVRRALLLGTTPPGGTAEKFPPPGDDVRKVLSKPVPTDDDYLFLFFAKSETSRATGRDSLARLRRRSGPPSPAVRPDALAKQASAITDWFQGANDILKSFKSIDKPVLVANGNQDVFFSVQQSVVLAREIPTAQLVIYPDSGHAPMFQYPEPFGRLMLDFLAPGGR